MGKPGKATNKMFAIASIIGATLKSSNTGDPKLLNLAVQSNKAMQVYSIKVGHTAYWEVSEAIKKIWFALAEKHENKLEHDEVPVFIQYVCMLVPENNFKSFLMVPPYTINKELSKEKNLAIVKSVLDLDNELNKLFGTRAHTVTKPKQKIAKLKKQRDKSKKKQKEKTVSRSKLKEAERKQNVRSFLRDRIAKAKDKEVS